VKTTNVLVLANSNNFICMVTTAVLSVAECSKLATRCELKYFQQRAETYPQNVYLKMKKMKLRLAIS